MPFLNNTTHQADLEIPVARFFENKREVAAVYLFGSHALGRQRPGSDVDIGILLCPEFLESGNSVREECIVGLGRILRKDIHPVILIIYRQAAYRKDGPGGRLSKSGRT